MLYSVVLIFAIVIQQHSNSLGMNVTLPVCLSADVTSAMSFGVDTPKATAGLALLYCPVASAATSTHQVLHLNL